MAQVTVDHAMRIAMEHHRSGRVAEAETIYRHVLSAQPNHAEALNLLGLVAAGAGRVDLATDLVRRAVAAAPGNATYYFHLGTLLQNQGHLDQAIASYQRALALKPGYAEVHNNLANAWKAKGQLDNAIACYQLALAVRPEFVDAHNNLGIAWTDKGLPDQAIACYQRSLALDPDFVDAHINLGIAWFGLGKLDNAIACYRRALVLRPNSIEALCNLGTALKDNRELDQAIDCYQRALSLKPGFVEACNNLGLAWKEKGQPDKAIDCHQRAIALDPACVKAHVNLGITLNDMGRHDQAIASLERALELAPNLIEAHANLGIAWKDKEQLDKAIACQERAVACDPRRADAHHNLANALRANGQIDKAIACYRQALTLNPHFVAAHDDLILTLLYQSDSDSRTLFDEAGRWNIQHAEPLRRIVESPSTSSGHGASTSSGHGPSTSSGHGHTNNRDPDRPLRIGYVSSDFMQHPCALFLLPLFRHHDRRQFEIICYAQVTHPDLHTRQFQDLVPVWRNTVRRTDSEVAAMIRDDQIDILVDLKLHTAGNRLLVFAHKPAPVQVTWLGYPGTTGMNAIDYRLTDPHLDPPDADQTCYSERTIRLPDTFWCYDPLTDEPQVNALPCLQNGYVTFGSLNNFLKINDDVLSLWAQVLGGIPGSRLILLAPQGSARRRVLDRMTSAGISPDRIEMLDRHPRCQYLQTFHRIDISLDTFPYNGHTTSLDSFWMGVPVITLVGPTIVGRAGLGQLTNLGLPDLIAHAPEQYIQIATKLAADTPRLNDLRSTLRQRMKVSPLMNADRFTRNIESAYRIMWQTWSASSH